jgi:hypothetical protein
MLGFQGQNVDVFTFGLQKVHDLHGHIIRQLAFPGSSGNQRLIDTQAGANRDGI